MKNIGVVSVSFRECTPEQIIKAVKEAGLSCIEWGSDVHAPQNNPEALQEIVRLQNEYGISCSSYGTYYRLGVNTLDELKAYIDAAKLLGADILRVWCGVKAPQNYSEEEKENFFAECRDAARIAEENGYEVAGLSREGYIDGIWNKESVEDWLTEIQLPVK